MWLPNWATAQGRPYAEADPIKWHSPPLHFDAEYAKGVAKRWRVMTAIAVLLLPFVLMAQKLWEIDMAQFALLVLYLCLTTASSGHMFPLDIGQNL